MGEDQKRRWDAWLGIVAPLLTVVGILVGVWQFNVGGSRKAAYEHASKLWLQRVDTYVSVAKQAGRIASPSDESSFRESVDAFMSSYWGEMILVEDAAAEKAMVDFRIEVEDFQKGRSDANRLKLRADALMQALKASLAVGAPRQ